VRVEISMFDGEGVEEWIQYFELYPLAEEQRIHSTLMVLLTRGIVG